MSFMIYSQEPMHFHMKEDLYEFMHVIVDFLEL